jgi:hypothetical protein
LSFASALPAFATPPLETFPETEALGRTPSEITFDMICAFVERRIVFISPATQPPFPTTN